MSRPEGGAGEPGAAQSGWKRARSALAPVAVSGGLIAWLLYTLDLGKLADALAQLQWRWLAPLTAAMVVALYLWDAYCLRLVFIAGSEMISYGRMLRIRGLSYLVGAFNYEAGQAMIAWSVARIERTSILTTLARSALLAYHDMIVLMSLGLAGALLTPVRPPEVHAAMVFCTAGLALLAAMTLAYRLLPEPSRAWFRGTRFGAWIDSWNAGRSLRLVALRLGYFGILIAYAALALPAAGIKLQSVILLSTIPLVLLADGVPNVFGLGVRESMLVLLLDPPEPEPLVAVSLVWSSGMVLVRLAIGFAHLWYRPSGVQLGSHVE